MSDSVPSCPEEVLSWIAWYPEGRLPDRVRGLIEAHAAECERCRAEIALVSGQAEPEAPTSPDLDAAFARVLARIESEAALRTEPRGATRGRAAPRGPRLGAGAGSAPLRIAAGLALLLLAGAAGILVGRALGSGPVYRTAAAGSAGVAAPGPELDVVFRADVSYEALERALRAEQATIVAGPSDGGTLRIALPEGADAPAAAARLRAEAALLAEPALR